jgi:hypothetical protein
VGRRSFLLAEWRAAQTARAEAKVTANVASATNASARDAVTTVQSNIYNERNITNEVTRCPICHSCCA